MPTQPDSRDCVTVVSVCGPDGEKSQALLGKLVTALAAPVYYKERGHRKGRLVRFVKNGPSRDCVTVISVGGRDGEECKVHRKRTIFRWRLDELYAKAEIVGPCQCMHHRRSTFAPVDRDDEGDCFHFHRVFVCGGCRRVAPWCWGGDRVFVTDPLGDDLCDDCAAAIITAKGL